MRIKRLPSVFLFVFTVHGIFGLSYTPAQTRQPRDQQVSPDDTAVLHIGSRRELFVDRFLIDEMDGMELKLRLPRPAAPPRQPVSRVDRLGAYVYAAVFKDGDIYRMYGRRERGARLPDSADRELRSASQVYVYAESRDGINWAEPDLGIYDNVPEIEAGNVVFAFEYGVTHNFFPFMDTRPGAPGDERYKAIGGGGPPWFRGELGEKHGPAGLKAYASPDGLHWRKLHDKPIIPGDWGMFDSQNTAFWSESERQYVCYFRVFDNKYTPGVRSIKRSTSDDFIHWRDPVDVHFNLPRPGGPNQYKHKYEQLYINNIKPYDRAPHIYVAMPTRINFDRNAPSETVLTTSRDGIHFDRVFTDVFCRPGLAGRYSNRGHYFAYHAIQTGRDELSLYNYHGQRWTLRLDGFASLHATFEGGRMTTKPLTFQGSALEINARTGAMGYVKVELLDEAGKPIRGYTAEDCDAFAGDNVAAVMMWRSSPDVQSLAARPVRLRFVMKDADVYSLRFITAKEQRP